MWKCWNAHNKQQVIEGENSLKYVKYDQHNPADAAHVLRMETCYCQVLPQVTGDGLWLCDLTTQNTAKKNGTVLVIRSLSVKMQLVLDVC